MKCPKCSYNQKMNQEGSTCKGCGRTFVFGKGADMTDSRFLSLVRRASANGTYHFTQPSLHAAYRAHLAKQSSSGCFIVSALLTILGGGALFSGAEAGAVALITAVIAFFTGLSRKKAPLGDYSAKVDHWVKSWKGDELDRMIRSPRLFDTPEETEEDDLYDYGVEGILLVSRDILVDLLVLNNFHAENRVLVLSNTYPKYLLPRVKALCQEERKVPIFLLHDAGDGFKPDLSSLGVPSDAEVIDLGLETGTLPRLVDDRSYSKLMSTLQLAISRKESFSAIFLADDNEVMISDFG